VGGLVNKFKMLGFQQPLQFIKSGFVFAQFGTERLPLMILLLTPLAKLCEKVEFVTIGRGTGIRELHFVNGLISRDRQLSKKLT
jgi:hypothetical protein